MSSLLLCLLGWAGREAHAQDLVPGAYTPAPTGVNVVTLTGTFNNGDVSFDQSLPVEDGHATLAVSGVGINRTLNLGGRFASVGLGVPFVHGRVSGRILGQFQEATRSGLGDVSGRIAINLLGAPAMTPREFAAQRAPTVVGVSLLVTAPVGQYDGSRLVNIGTNRWLFKPEVGVSRRRGAWRYEANLGVTFFTDNMNYAAGTREQAPIIALQGHLVRNFRPGFWLAADANV